MVSLCRHAFTFQQKSRPDNVKKRWRLSDGLPAVVLAFLDFDSAFFAISRKYKPYSTICKCSTCKKKGYKNDKIYIFCGLAKLSIFSLQIFFVTSCSFWPYSAKLYFNQMRRGLRCKIRIFVKIFIACIITTYVTFVGDGICDVGFCGKCFFVFWFCPVGGRQLARWVWYC